MIDLLRLSVAVGLMGVAVGVAAGCDAEGADADPRGSAESGGARVADGPRETDESALGAGEWATRTVGGVPIRVRADQTPLRPGPVHFRIEVPSTAADTASFSADLVSPTMPMHGVQRYPVERTQAGEYVAEVEIPMAGEWMLYVNLDIGADAARFEFTVPASDTTATHDMGEGHVH
ncbi:MAG: hypothetical protein ACODAE_09095 [Gemmatimonadota bacterium]